MQKYDLALSDFSKAIEINPNLAQAYLGRGGLYAILRQTEKAKIDLQQIILLIQCLEWWWREREVCFAAGNLTIYYSPNQKNSQN